MSNFFPSQSGAEGGQAMGEDNGYPVLFFQKDSPVAGG